MNLTSAEKINLSSLNLDEKVAQMIIIKAENFDERFLDLGVGGIFMSKQKTKKEYKDIIQKYQENSKIKLLVSTDMEGYWNPFSKFYKSKSLGSVKDRKEAHEFGKEHGETLGELGFNLNFAPVVEIRNKVWPGRSFTGTEKEVKEKISGYIKGLKEEGILATAKHYPGGNMIRDPHWLKFKAEIYRSDLEMFDIAVDNNVDAVMIGHPIVYGAINSDGKQSTISYEVIYHLKKEQKFDGLVITDSIYMLGLRWSYLFRFDDIYIDLIKAGNDIILEIPMKKNPSYKKIEKRI